MQNFIKLIQFSKIINNKGKNNLDIEEYKNIEIKESNFTIRFHYVPTFEMLLG